MKIEVALRIDFVPDGSQGIKKLSASEIRESVDEQVEKLIGYFKERGLLLDEQKTENRRRRYIHLNEDDEDV